MRFLKILVVVVVFVGLIFFCVQNKDVFEQTSVFSFKIPVLMDMAWQSPETPMLFIFASALLLGAFVVWFYLLLGNVRSGNVARQYRTQVKKLQAENEKLTQEVERLENTLAEPVSMGPDVSSETEETTGA